MILLLTDYDQWDLPNKPSMLWSIQWLQAQITNSILDSWFDVIVLICCFTKHGDVYYGQTLVSSYNQKSCDLFRCFAGALLQATFLNKLYLFSLLLIVPSATLTFNIVTEAFRARHLDLLFLYHRMVWVWGKLTGAAAPGMIVVFC